MPNLKLYRVSQTSVRGYDTFDSFVGAYASEDEAKIAHPFGGTIYSHGGYYDSRVWATKYHLDSIHVEYLGEADAEITSGIICSSFNAG